MPYHRKTRYKVLLNALIVFLLLFLISWLCIDYFIDDAQMRGVFGDKFGAVNSFFSGLVVVGLIYTIYLQKEELRLQREELRQTREEMNKQTKEFDEQNRNLQIQRFENTFFNMMGLLQEIIQGLSINTTRPILSRSWDPSGKTHRDWQSEIITKYGRQVFCRWLLGIAIWRGHPTSPCPDTRGRLLKSWQNGWYIQHEIVNESLCSDCKS